MIRPAPGSFPRMPLAQNSARGSTTNVNPAAPLSELKDGGSLPQTYLWTAASQSFVTVRTKLSPQLYGCPQPSNVPTHGSNRKGFSLPPLHLGLPEPNPYRQWRMVHLNGQGNKKHVCDVGNELFHYIYHKLRNGDQLVGRLICRDFWASQKVLFELF